MSNPWDELSQPSKDVTARRIDPAHILDLFWARDHLGRYLFIYEFSLEAELSKTNLPNLVGIQTAITQADNPGGKKRLILVLNQQSNWEIFLSLCNDLIQVTRQTENSIVAIRTILSRLEHWQEFLRRNRMLLLGEEKILGLIGELLFIRNCLIPVFGAGQSIKFWQGPEGFPQDFNVNECAIEIKCQLGATRPYVKISSADQLCPQLPEMYLYVFTLGKTMPETPDAINLPKLVSQIGDALRLDASDQRHRFSNHLDLLGYFDSEHYLEFSYILSATHMFRVMDDFPRICSNELRRGIENLTYSISLSECTRFEGQPDWMVA